MMFTKEDHEKKVKEFVSICREMADLTPQRIGTTVTVSERVLKNGVCQCPVSDSQIS